MMIWTQDGCFGCYDVGSGPNAVSVPEEIVCEKRHRRAGRPASPALRRGWGGNRRILPRAVKTAKKMALKRALPLNALKKVHP